MFNAAIANASPERRGEVSRQRDRARTKLTRGLTAIREERAVVSRTRNKRQKMEEDVSSSSSCSSGSSSSAGSCSAPPPLGSGFVCGHQAALEDLLEAERALGTQKVARGQKEIQALQVCVSVLLGLY